MNDDATRGLVLIDLGGGVRANIGTVSLCIDTVVNLGVGVPEDGRPSRM